MVPGRRCPKRRKPFPNGRKGGKEMEEKKISKAEAKKIKAEKQINYLKLKNSLNGCFV